MSLESSALGPGVVISGLLTGSLDHEDSLSGAPLRVRSGPWQLLLGCLGRCPSPPLLRDRSVLDSSGLGSGFEAPLKGAAPAPARGFGGASWNHGSLLAEGSTCPAHPTPEPPMPLSSLMPPSKHGPDLNYNCPSHPSATLPQHSWSRWIPLAPAMLLGTILGYSLFLTSNPCSSIFLRTLKSPHFSPSSQSAPYF